MYATNRGASMTERASQVRTLVAELANAMRRCEQRARLDRMELAIKGVEPEGPKVKSEVQLRPCPADANLVKQVITQIEQIVAKWEADSGLWVETLSLVWRGDPPARIPEDLHFRQAY
jgi:hypothetical protein